MLVPASDMFWGFDWTEFEDLISLDEHVKLVLERSREDRICHECGDPVVSGVEFGNTKEGVFCSWHVIPDLG